MSSEWMRSRLEEMKNRPFLMSENRVYQYDDLVKHIDIWMTQLDHLDIARGDCIAIIGDYSANVLFLLIALLLNENIVVPVSMETKENHDTFFSVAQVNGYFEFDERDEWIYHSRSRLSCHPLLERLRSMNESGIIFFSSGTTGENKACVHQVSKLLEKYRSSNRKAFRTLIFLKLDHIGGINTLFSIMFSGGTLITCKDRALQSVCSAIEKYEVELLPTTPTFLNMMIISRAYEDYDLSSLRMITYGTEPMPLSTLTSLNKIFPSVTIKQTYGLTELGIFATQSRESSSNWMKIGGEGIETKVVNDTLFVKTCLAMLGYLNAASPFDEEGWFNTGDEVEIDGEYVRIRGRKEELINVGGEKVYPSEIESSLLEIPNVLDVLVEGKSSPVIGNIVTATFVLEKQEQLNAFKKRVFAFCKERMESYKIPRIISISDTTLMGDRLKKRRLRANREAKL